MSDTDISDTNTSMVTVEGPVIHSNHASLVAWLVLNVWPSHLGLPILIATILLSERIRRHATFINMCITWIIVGISSSLLLYSGFTTGPEPPKALCLLQASLLYAQPGMTSLSAFALVFQVFYVVRAAYYERDPQNNQVARKWVLLVAPYIALLAFSGITAYVGGADLNRVSRSRRFFYCSVKSTLLTNSITTFSFFVLLATMVLLVWIAVLTYKQWRILRHHRLKTSTTLDFNLIIRTVAFGVWVVLGMSLSLLSIKAPESPVPDMALATMGSAVVLIFGTQRDIRRALLSCSCRRDRLRIEEQRESRLQLAPLPSNQSSLPPDSAKGSNALHKFQEIIGIKRKRKSIATWLISSPKLRESSNGVAYAI